MEITQNKTIKELGFNTLGEFPKVEREKIARAIKNIRFKDFPSYSQRDAFDKALSDELGSDYLRKSSIFEESMHALDLYNNKLNVAVEIEKTKATTLLLDVMKFIMGHKNGKIDYGVFIIPDRYRTEKKPKGDADIFYNRLINELNFIRPIVEIKDILIIEYDTSCLSFK